MTGDRCGGLGLARGTSPAGLWEAVVAFRFAAAGVVGFSGPRLAGLVRARVLTGALAVTQSPPSPASARGGGRAGPYRRSVPWRSAALALAGWELVAASPAAASGRTTWSVWSRDHAPRRGVGAGSGKTRPGRPGRRLAYAVAATAVSWSLHATSARTPTDDQVAASYVRDHARPGDTVVVAFGHADIVEASGLGSPYPYLWTLPAFVEDPHLRALDRLLASPAAPRWFVAGGDLSQWGAPGAAVQRTVDRHYSVASGRAVGSCSAGRNGGLTRLGAPSASGTAAVNSSGRDGEAQRS